MALTIKASTDFFIYMILEAQKKIKSGHRFQSWDTEVLWNIMIFHVEPMADGGQ